MDRRETLKHILEAYRCNPTPEQLGAAIEGIEELFADCETQTKPLEERKREFLDSIRPYLDKYGKDMCNAFGKYWLEISPRGRKYRFEKEKTWNTKLRLETWSRNQRKFSVVNMLRK